MTIPERVNQIIETISRVSGTVMTRVMQSWKLTIGVAVILLASSVGFLIYALQEPSRAPVVNGPGETATSTVNLNERALDGMLVHASSTHLLPYGVMVENSADAWPLQGPAKANLVFEAPVEGSITRLLLLFDASSTVDTVGPVRSARPYFVEWADGLDALYAHVGGSPDGLSLISSLNGFRDLNEFYNGWVFWRSAARSAPHNIYTSTELLTQGVAKKEYLPGTFEPWTYADPSTSTERVVDVERIAVPYDGIYAGEWRYDEEQDDYVRFRRGLSVTDADGTPVRMKNVVVMLTDAQVLDDIGRLKVRTTGRGKAIVFTGGKKREGSWFRSAGGHIRFEGIDGTDVVFTRGSTWISVLTSGEAFDRVVPE